MGETRMRGQRLLSFILARWCMYKKSVESIVSRRGEEDKSVDWCIEVEWNFQ